jgi:surfeit locus 1 family protein
LQLTHGNRRFRPGLAPTLAVLVLAPTFFALGNWQLDRAQQKRERLAQFEQAASPAPLASLARIGQRAEEGFRHVRASGRYVATRQVLLEGMGYQGRSGYHVLSPFRLDSGVLVMINRGWIARDFAAGDLPAVTPPSPTPRRLDGLLTPLPRPGLRLEGGELPDAEAPVVAMLYPEASALTALLGEPVFDGVVLLSPSADDGFVRDWRPAGVSPQKHVGYAVQWFSFAGTLLLLYLILNFRRPAVAADGQGRYGSDAA